MGIKENAYLDRMKEECSQLSERIAKLSAFIMQSSVFNGFGEEKKELMEGQLHAMKLYEYFLDGRIKMETKEY